ncbi:phage baseplate protein [Fusobacterium ulcerans]
MGILTNFLKLLKPEPNDFVDVVKHISENYDKLDRNAETTNKTLTDLGNNKLDKGTYTKTASDLNTEISKIASTTQLGRIIVGDNLTIDEAGRLSGKKVDLSNYYDKPEIEEKFKNFCPYNVGDIYITTFPTNPATKYLGTTWEKIEGKFLLATSGSNASGQTGGSNTKTITQANLPNVKLKVDSFNLGRGTQEITGQIDYDRTPVKSASGAFAATYNGENVVHSGTDDYRYYDRTVFTASRTWTGMSTSASPYTSALGSGTPLDITPSFYTVHIWKRLS